LYCLLKDSPYMDDRECQLVNENKQKTVNQGRQAELVLYKSDQEPIKLRDWASEIFDDLDAVATLLDSAHGDKQYQKVIAQEKQKLSDSDLTPSGRILKQMEEEQISFFQLGLKQALAHRDYYAEADLEPTKLACIKGASEQSLADQRRIEAEDEVGFDEFLADHMAKAGY